MTGLYLHACLISNDDSVWQILKPSFSAQLTVIGKKTKNPHPIASSLPHISSSDKQRESLDEIVTMTKHREEPGTHTSGLIELLRMKGRRKKKTAISCETTCQKLLLPSISHLSKIKNPKFPGWQKINKQDRMWKTCGHFFLAIESIRWELVVMLLLWSDSSAPMGHINLFNSE